MATAKTVLERPRRPVEDMTYRRKQEQVIEDRMAHNKVNLSITERARWENVTDGKILGRLKKDRRGQLQSEVDADLAFRRKQLAGLYNAEMNAWREEINANEESIEERKMRLIERASVLRDERESRRKEFVDKCYSDQWRLACDDARTLDSKAILDYVCENRLQQLDEKKEKQALLDAEDAGHNANNAVRMKELEKLELDKVAMRHTMDGEVKKILDQQVADLTVRKSRLKEAQHADARMELDELANALAEEADKEAKIKENAYIRGHEVREYNEARLGTRAAEKKVQLERDQVLLRYAIAKEQQDEAREQAKRDGEKQAMKTYQNYLKEQMIKEKEDNKDVDVLRLKLENRIWEAKALEQRKQDDARSYLMSQVDIGRQQQITDKAKREVEELASGQIEVNAIRELQEKYNKMEDDKADEMRLSRLENARGLGVQKVDKSKRVQREEQAKHLEHRIMEKTEEEHKGMLASQAGVVKLYRPLKHTQWYT